jgi:hypothetical protein
MVGAFSANPKGRTCCISLALAGGGFVQMSAVRKTAMSENVASFGSRRFGIEKASPSSIARWIGLVKQWITGISGCYDFRSGAHRESHVKTDLLEARRLRVSNKISS